jgi:outer membrane beta-barrel protein
MMDRAYADYLEDPANPDQGFPQLNYPKSETLALINWYPFYGKISLFEKAVAHFDFYFIGGYGQVALKDGSTPTYTGGAGLGFWLSPHVSSRIEMRYQNYKAQYFTGEKSMDLAIASMQLGWLL